jgi:hypothetical protein
LLQALAGSKSLKPDRQSPVVLFAIMLAIASAAAQSGPTTAQPAADPSDLVLDWHGVEHTLYANAKRYVELSFTELKSALPELRELEPAANQDRLPALLHNTGYKSRDLLHNMPNLIAHEKLVTQNGLKSKPWRQEYEYLIFSRPAKNNMVLLDEYRTATSGKRIQGVDDPLSKGFASEWMRFYPSNQSESRFGYLGQQAIDGRQTFVLAFAQIPDAARFPTQVEFGGTTIAVLDQGIAWIDETDFRIIRIRTDLLAPRPDIYLQKMTAEVHFTELLLPQSGPKLSVPDEALVTWNFKGQTGQQRHTYSSYRFYAVQTKIVP